MGPPGGRASGRLEMGVRGRSPLPRARTKFGTRISSPRQGGSATGTDLAPLRNALEHVLKSISLGRQLMGCLPDSERPVLRSQPRKVGHGVALRACRCDWTRRAEMHGTFVSRVHQTLLEDHPNLVQIFSNIEAFLLGVDGLKSTPQDSVARLDGLAVTRAMG